MIALLASFLYQLDICLLLSLLAFNFGLLLAPFSSIATPLTHHSMRLMLLISLTDSYDGHDRTRM